MIGVAIGMVIKPELSNKDMDIDISCNNIGDDGKGYCVLDDLDFYNRINKKFFEEITEGHGLCGTIQLYNQSHLNMVYCGKSLEGTYD